MDITKVLSRGNKVAAVICAIIVLIGFGTSLVLGGLSDSGDNLRIEQLRLSEFKAKLNQVPGSLNAIRLEPEPNEKNSQTVATEISALQLSAIDGHLPISPLIIEAFVKAAKREIKANSVRQFDEANRIRMTLTDPTLKRLVASVDQSIIDLGGDVRKVRQKSQALRNLTFAIAGLLIILIVIAFQVINAAEAKKDKLRHSQEINGLRFAALVQNSTDVILLTSRKGAITLVNDASMASWGLSPQSCVGKQVIDLFHSIESVDLLRAFDEALASPNIDIDTTVKIEIRPDVKHTFQVNVRNLLDNVHIGGMLLTFHDMTERAAVEEALTHQASHDRLTGLPNRGQVMIRLEDALKRSKATGQRVGSLFIDLDNFKTINDTLGHEIGDLLLINVAQRIQNSVRPSDMAARLGGDEFIVVLNNAGELETGETIAKRIAEQFSTPFHLGAHEVSVTASIGVAFSEMSDEEPNDLLRRADAAMYEAKHNGKSGYVIYAS